jgi:hypothetical protein
MPERLWDRPPLRVEASEKVPLEGIGVGAIALLRAPSGVISLVPSLPL